MESIAANNTPPKLHKGLGRLITIVVLALITAGVVLASFFLCRNIGALNLFEQEVHVQNLYKYSYALYWKLHQTEQNDYSLTPAEVLYPGLAAVGQGGGASSEAQAIGGEEDINAEIVHFEQELLQLMATWETQLRDEWAAQNYCIVNNKTGVYYGNPTGSMLAVATDGPEEKTLREMQDAFRYFFVLRYGPQGQLSVPALYGASEQSIEAVQHTTFNTLLLDEINGRNLSAFLERALQQPSDVTVVFAVPHGTSIFEEKAFQVWALQNSGLWFYLAGGIALSGLLGLLFASIRVLGVRNLAIGRMPLELSLLLFAPLALACNGTIASWLFLTHNQGGIFANIAVAALSPSMRTLLGYAFLCGALFLLFGGIYAGAASLWQMRTLGWRQYLAQKTLVIVLLRWLSRGAHTVLRWVTRLDFTAKSSVQALKIVLANMVVVAGLVSIGGLGFLLLPVYCAVVFALLVRYLSRIKAQYKHLADATQKMAQGKLDVQIPEDLGPFEPLKQNLTQVQQGFSKAVAAETKSQNMKTELIANVSHDLKTPLTAIITYIGLLKKEDITPEERRSYTETLDKKSQRLKRLIEDLFEMSKAASRDVALHYAMIDLPSLVRQVEAEARDELDAAGIEFRYRVPPEKICLSLDGEKTSRIFENLVLNVAKYGMPGTRAYVEMHTHVQQVTVEMKNVSRAELNFDNEQITERFVRGDLSRSTEGSGLGLAIAKSFTELQGGRFAIQTDGDVFKASVTFPVRPPPAPPLSQPGHADVPPAAGEAVKE